VKIGLMLQIGSLSAMCARKKRLDNGTPRAGGSIGISRISACFPCAAKKPPNFFYIARNLEVIHFTG
jgi:hypothetical protein